MSLPIRPHVTVHVYMPGPMATTHHNIRPQSLEDRCRVKQQMINTHVLLGMCEDREVIYNHHVSVCNCTNFTREELAQILEEAIVDYILPTELRFRSDGYTFIPTKDLVAYVGGLIHGYYPFPSDQKGTCAINFLKSVNLAMVCKELMVYICPNCGERSIGFVYNSPPFVVPVYYSLMQLVTFYH